MALIPQISILTSLNKIISFWISRAIQNCYQVFLPNCELSATGYVSGRIRTSNSRNFLSNFKKPIPLSIWLYFEPEVRFELTRPYGSWLQVKRSRPLSHSGLFRPLVGIEPTSLSKIQGSSVELKRHINDKEILFFRNPRYVQEFKNIFTELYR